MLSVLGLKNQFVYSRGRENNNYNRNALNNLHSTHFANSQYLRKFEFNKHFTTDSDNERPLPKLGDSAFLDKHFTQSEVNSFCEISNDNNDIHTNRAAALQAGFRDGPIIHGVLGLGLLSAVIGTKLPGKGTIYMNQNISFLKPIVVGQKVRAKAEIIKFEEKRPWIVTLSTKAFIVTQSPETGEEKELLAIDGEALVMIPWVKAYYRSKM